MNKLIANSNFRIIFALIVSIAFTVIIWIVRYYYFQNPIIEYIVIVSFLISIAFVIAFSVIFIGKNFKFIQEFIYRKTKERLIHKLLDYELGDSIRKFLHFVLFSMLINFLVLSIIAVSVLNPSISNQMDLSFVPFLGEYLGPLMQNYKVPLAMWLNQDFMYTVAFSSIGPATIVLLRHIRRREKLENPEKYLGSSILYGFLFIAPLIIFTSSLPPSDPLFIISNLSLTAIFSISVLLVSTIMYYAELFSKKFLKL